MTKNKTLCENINKNDKKKAAYASTERFYFNFLIVLKFFIHTGGLKTPLFGRFFI